MSNSTFAHTVNFSKETEHSVLGAMLLDNKVISTVLEIVHRDVFMFDKNKKLFDCIVSLFERNIEADIITVMSEIYRRGYSNHITSHDVSGILISCPTVANVEQHCRILLEYYFKRKLIDIGHYIVRRSSNPMNDALEEIDNAESLIFRIAEQRLRKSFYSTSELSYKVFGLLTSLVNKKDGSVTGVPSGFTAIDNLLFGFQNSDLIVLAARPSMGKTGLALSICRNAAITYKMSVAVFSLEMAGVQLMQRLLSMESGVPMNQFRGNINNYSLVNISKAIDVINEAEIHIDDSSSLTLTELKAKCRRMKLEHNIKLIVIDYLQLLSAKAESREREISIISRELKKIAKELDIPVIALSQLNRGVESRHDKRPLLSDLRESGSIEQDADVVLFINRPEYYGITEYENGQPTDGTAEIIVAKQRNGSTGSATLAFIKEQARFENLALQTELPVHKNTKEDVF